MADADKDYIWVRIAELATPQDSSAPLNPFKPKDEKARKQLRRVKIAVGVMDCISTLLWTYAFLKLFVGDVDRWVVERVDSSLVWLVDFRFFIALGALALVLALLRKLAAAWPFAYIAFFPLIVVLWKIPRFLFRLKSGVATLGALHVLSGVVGGVRRAIIGGAVLMFSFFTVVFGGESLITVGMVALGALLVAWLYRAIRSAIRPSSFITAQQRIISKIVGSQAFEKATNPQQKVDKESVATWTNTEAVNYVTTASFGVVAYRAAHYWAFSLDLYRRGAASVAFGSLTVLTLFVQVALTFGFLNYGLHRIDVSQFQYEADPTVWTFLYYSFAGCFFGEIGALMPVGTVAFVFKIINGILGGIIVLTLITSIVLGVRHTRTDEVSLQAIRDLKSRADAYGKSLGDMYGGGSVEELEARLLAFKFALSGLLGWLIRQSPPDWAPK